jgi:hypothetical protein
MIVKTWDILQVGVLKYLQFYTGAEGVSCTDCRRFVHVGGYNGSNNKGGGSWSA